MTMTVDGFFSGPNGELDWMASASPRSSDTSAITTLAPIRGYLGEPAYGRGAEAASGAGDDRRSVGEVHKNSSTPQ